MDALQEGGGISSSAQSGRAKVIAEVISGPHAGERFEFERHETLLVGRTSAAQLCLNQDPHFSRHHFCLEVNPPECYFRDLGSRNGTYINRERVEEKRLFEGDIISGGKTQIRISIVSVAGEYSPNVDTVIPPTAASSQAPAVPPVVDQTPQQLVPGFDVIEQIGSGGMGLVYRATQKSTSREVALKVITPAQTASEDSIQLFIREANILSGLDHPHIVRFYEFGMVLGRMFLAMEYVKTIDLKQLLQDQSNASRIRIPCAIACQVLDALGYSHSRSLIHRDIKPPNILLTLRNRKLHVKLADFGLAKNYVNAGMSGMTLEGDMRGTVSYSPPEQILDSRYAKPTSDIYSLGATLYEYLSGSSPYDFMAGRSQIVTILESEPVPLAVRCPELPAELTTAVQRALAKDPSDRFSSAQEMRQALLPFSKREKK